MKTLVENFVEENFLKKTICFSVRLIGNTIRTLFFKFDLEHEWKYHRIIGQTKNRNYKNRKLFFITKIINEKLFKPKLNQNQINVQISRTFQFSNCKLKFFVKNLET